MAARKATAALMMVAGGVCGSGSRCDGADCQADVAEFDASAMLQIRHQVEQLPVPERFWAACRLSDSKCSLKDMDGKPTLVYPGGNTKCGNGGAYAFAVYPGDPDKLAIYFEGGGACWESNGALGKIPVDQCTKDLWQAMSDSGAGQGLLDSSNGENPINSWTIVELLYCSGDAFVGNTTLQTQNGIVHQYGYYNAEAAVAWAKKNFPGKLDSFLAGGWSAGSLGTMAWAGKLLDTFKHSRVGAVLLDSYAGIFPAGVQEYTLQRWNACDTGLLSEEMRQLCVDGKATTKQSLIETMERHPDVAYGSIQSKEDGSQIWFYQGMAQSWGMQDDMDITASEFYELTNALYEDFQDVRKDYTVFYVDGSQHCFTPNEKVYSASTAGKDAPPPGHQPTMLEWITNFLRQKVKLECNGPVVSDPTSAEGTNYCSADLISAALLAVGADISG